LEDNVAPHVKKMPKMETFMSSRLRIFIRFHRWDEILKIPEPDHSLVRTIAIWHFARGSAMASTGKSEQAELELGEFEAAANSIPANAAWGNNRVATVFEFLSIVLKARIALAKGDTKHAIQLFNEAIKIEDGFIYDEPTAWNEPTRELLGALLFQTGDYLQAEKTFRTDLEQHPQNGRSLFGLAQSLKAQGKNRDALIAERKFEAAWKTADTKLRMEDW
jgi:tetratricopeptide (TPR) repeat protein